MTRYRKLYRRNYLVTEGSTHTHTYFIHTACAGDFTATALYMRYRTLTTHKVRLCNRVYRMYIFNNCTFASILSTHTTKLSTRSAHCRGSCGRYSFVRGIVRRAPHHQTRNANARMGSERDVAAGTTHQALIHFHTSCTPLIYTCWWPHHR